MLDVHAAWVGRVVFRPKGPQDRVIRHELGRHLEVGGNDRFSRRLRRHRYLFRRAAWAAASRAIGTRNGEQDT